MRRSLSRAEVRDIDRRAIEDFGLPGIVLMENAARGCVECLVREGVSGPVAICAGRGNNGGDGFAMARHLENRGIAVKVLLFGDPEKLRGDAAINFGVLTRSGTPLKVMSVPTPADEAELQAELAESDWIVDALLGTGTQGSLRPPFPSIIRAINNSGARVFAVDLPSGMDCDSGLPADPDCPVMVKAEITATFVARKRGFDHPSAAEYTGRVHVVDIGAPRAALPD